MLAASRRSNLPVTMIPSAMQDDDEVDGDETSGKYGTAALGAGKTKASNPLKLFYSRSKSSSSSLAAAVPLKNGAKLDNSKSDKNKNKKKPKSKPKKTQQAGNINESINFSSASSSGYNSHINPGESSLQQQHQQQHFSQQSFHHQRPNNHLQPQTDASLPATLNDTFISGAYGRQQYRQDEADELQPQQHHWRRSVSLRAPMVPMMIDDEIELIDDMDEANHQQRQLQPQPQYQFQHHHYYQNGHQYQQHQQQFLLSDESGEPQCVDSAEPLSYHHHQDPSQAQTTNYHNDTNQSPSEPPPLPLHHHYLRTGHRDDDGDDDDDDDDEDEEEDDGVAAQYSQVRHPSGKGYMIANQDNYADRISILQQKQQQQMRLASALRQRQQQETANQLSSKPTFNLDGPILRHQQHQYSGPSSGSNNSNSNGKFPLAIYHQPNLNNNSNHHQQRQQQYNTFSHHHQQQQQVGDLQHRYQPAPFSQTTQTPPLTSGGHQLNPHSLSTRSAGNARKLLGTPRAKQQHQQQIGASNRRNSTGTSSSQTDSGALVSQSTSEPSSGSASISATIVQQLNTSSKRMQAVGAIGGGGGGGNRNLHHYNQPHRLKSPPPNQGSGGGGGGGSGSRRAQKSHSSNQNGQSDDGEPTLGFCGKFAKLLLFVSNILFWSAGIALGAWGILSLVDDHKYNLSQLLVFEPSTKMSLFQLLSWSFITLGCATILVGFCGCSAIFKNNRWILGLYIFLILAIFALDLATGLLAIIFQERLVANVRLRLANKLRSDYGVQASFTAAIDYIQTRYECCGLEGHFDYDQSLWRLQRLGGFEATVARTCCHLRNTFDDQAHVNPRPVNESMCQSNDVRFHQSYRYRKGCLDDLERLVRHKIWTFTIGCGAVGGVILLSLLFATCFCRSIPSAGGSRKSSSQQQQHQSNHQDNNSNKKKQSGFIQTTNAQQQLQRQYHR